jgi:hypothetical protein
MKFGVREICDVVLKAKAPQKIGNKIFYTNEPVLYFDTLKTSTMEGAATTVYAQGGRGNARLVAWEGERTVTFTMEDALISPEGFMILSGAGLIEGSANKPIYQHITETVDGSKITKGTGTIQIRLSQKPYLPVASEKTIGVEGNYAYVMLVKNGEIVSEPYIPEHVESEEGLQPQTDPITGEVYYLLTVAAHENYDTLEKDQYQVDEMLEEVGAFDSAIVDYYVAHTSSDAMQIEITADKFGGNYYLEASTLFRDTSGVDMPAEFIIPNCKIQSNFTFSMASSGDPSTFTFTMDAFPDYTRFDKSKKVLAAIQIIKDASSQDLYRYTTAHNITEDGKRHDVIFG